jgi:hypothetical protein
MALWLLFGLSMKAPPAVKSKMYHLNKISGAKAKALATKLAALSGVRETVVLADEGMVILKVDLQQNWDEAAALKLIGE